MDIATQYYKEEDLRHAIKVSSMVGEGFSQFLPDKDRLLTVALFHNILESTRISIIELNEIFSIDIMNDLKRLARRDRPYSNYIKSLQEGSYYAKAVKISDIKYQLSFCDLSNSEKDILLKSLLILI